MAMCWIVLLVGHIYEAIPPCFVTIYLSCLSDKLLIFRDHAGGNDKMKELVPGIKVFGGSIDNVKGCTDKLDNGDKLSLGAEVNILSLHTPW